MIACARCARENPDDARFCNGCGAALPTDQRARAERKVVTAVFVDLVGSTARAEQLDPEDVRALLRRYHETLRRRSVGSAVSVPRSSHRSSVAATGRRSSP